jgi:hypothetical protein|tara:strand:- start:1094 stop:1549 length:456 start_codon:yes stop_codon:yes gene_type:complete
MAMTPKTPKTKRTLGRNPRTDGRSRRAFELARERKASGRLTTDDINRALKTLGRKGALKAGVGAGVGAAGLIKRMLGAGMSPDQLKKRIAGLKDKLGKRKMPEGLQPGVGAKRPKRIVPGGPARLPKKGAIAGGPARLPKKRAVPMKKKKK